MGADFESVSGLPWGVGGAGRNRGVSARTRQLAGERGAEDSSMGSNQAL